MLPGKRGGVEPVFRVARNCRRLLAGMLSELERTAFLNSRVLGRERRHDPALKALSASRIFQTQPYCTWSGERCDRTWVRGGVARAGVGLQRGLCLGSRKN